MARPSRRPGNLPAEVTSFIGRRRELAEVRKALGNARLVSLTGPGGVGKSRLAIRIASELARRFRDGAWLVELAELRDPGLVSNAVMAALDLRDQSGTDPLVLLLNHLRDKQALLLVDNCEHLLDAAGHLVQQLIRTVPSVQIIITSREPLGIDGEHVLPVPPFELPLVEPLALDSLRQNEAVALFCSRAHAASGTFELGDGNKAAVVEICRRLDGLPLAIELAAVRVRVLSAEQIRERLNDRFGLLTAGGKAALPRHQTLRTAIDWSYDLLGANEQRFLRRLALFAGRFSFEDAEAVCSGDERPPSAVLDELASLVDKSLVMKDDLSGVAAYRLHETMREYCRSKLLETGEHQRGEQRFIEYYWGRCGRPGGDARYRLAEWLDWMDLEIDNIRDVLGRCLSHGDSRRGLDVAAGLGWYWITRATSEGVRWLDAMLDLGPGQPESQFWAFFLRGFLAVLKSDPASARPALERALASARDLSQPALLAQALCMASIAHHLGAEQEAAIDLLHQAETVTAGLDDYPAQISLLQARVFNGFFQGDIALVRATAADGVRLSRNAGDLYSLEMMLLNSGTTAFALGEVQRAKGLYVEALSIAKRIDDRVAQYALLDGLASVAAAMEEGKLAARLLGAAETIRTQAGARLIPVLAPMIAQAEERAVERIGRSTFDAELEAGRRLSRDDAIRLGLGQPAEDRNGSRPVAALPLLGRREADVARLIADGLSNKQIGARLFISERTVDSHVRSILNKLGVNSRAQIAGWITAKAEAEDS